MSKPTVQDRLLDIIQQLITNQGASPNLAARVAELEQKIAAIEAEWPQIKENENGTS